MSALRLLGGRDPRSGAESLAEHVARLGPLPVRGGELIEVLIESGTSGRGGAAFPVGVKWRATARAHGSPLVVVNGAEGEPHSKKDRLLMTARPHLVLDGAFLAARVLRSHQVVLYIGEQHHAARLAMERALGERSAHERSLVRMFAAPNRYVAGDSNAAVQAVTSGVALPTTFKAAPALVQNVETLAQVALIARGGHPTGTVLVTLAGSIAHPGVIEVETTATIGDVVARAGGFNEPARAVLLGGYFGSWLATEQAMDLRLDPSELKASGLTLGCGAIAFLPSSRCPVCETAGIMRFLAGESSSQCGPCFFGLRALADACTRVAYQGANPQDLGRLERWAVEVRGRGACKHPDGAVMFLQSALETFAAEFARHTAHTVQTARRSA
ncbi:MAG TPA: NADH-ubiquinone oxidoreductase-F iron-sulfur binding region domain-containing protein [Candidatus Dormibacteraeota bacterium]|nr:NADH-ubiquinone oxidoreductase-F iron-sulfur binding region domain-containing protein [Candidatus Dormibacteraeota bacterium]